MKNIYISHIRISNLQVGIGREENLGHHKKSCLYLFNFHDENLKPIKMCTLFVQSEQRKNGLDKCHTQYILVDIYLCTCIWMYLIQVQVYFIFYILYRFTWILYTLY